MKQELSAAQAAVYDREVPFLFPRDKEIFRMGKPKII